MHFLFSLVLLMSLSTDFWQRVPVPAFGDLGPNWTQYQLQGQGNFFVVETGTLNFGVGTIPGTHETVALYFRQAQTGAQHADFTSSSPGYNSDGSAAPIFGFSGPVIRGQDKDNFYFGGTRWTFSYSMIQRTVATTWSLYFQQGRNAWYLGYNCTYPPAGFMCWNGHASQNLNDPTSGNDFNCDVSSGEQLYDFYIKAWTPGGLIVNGGSVVIGKRSDPSFSRTLYQNILDPYAYAETQQTTLQVPGPPTLAITFEIWKRVGGTETKLASMPAGGGQVATRLSCEAGVLKLWMHNETTDTVLLQVADSALQTGDLVGMIASLELSATSVTTAMLCTGWEASGGGEPVFLAVDSYGRVFPVQNLRSQPDIGALANDGVIFFTEDGGIVNLNGFQTADLGDQITRVISGATFCRSGCQTGCEAGCEGTCEVGCQSVCQMNCQAGGCQTGCQAGCEAGCQGTCQLGCQSGCQLNCQAGGCQSGCETGCETGCQGTPADLRAERFERLGDCNLAQGKCREASEAYRSAAKEYYYEYELGGFGFFGLKKRALPPEASAEDQRIDAECLKGYLELAGGRTCEGIARLERLVLALRKLPAASELRKLRLGDARFLLATAWLEEGANEIGAAEGYAAIQAASREPQERASLFAFAQMLAARTSPDQAQAAAPARVTGTAGGNPFAAAAAAVQKGNYVEARADYKRILDSLKERDTKTVLVM